MSISHFYLHPSYSIWHTRKGGTTKADTKKGRKTEIMSANKNFVVVIKMLAGIYLTEGVWVEWRCQPQSSTSQRLGIILGWGGSLDTVVIIVSMVVPHSYRRESPFNFDVSLFIWDIFNRIKGSRIVGLMWLQGSLSWQGRGFHIHPIPAPLAWVQLSLVVVSEQ